MVESASPLDRIKDQFRRGAEPIGGLIARTGLTPNAVTVIGCLLNFGVAVVLALGYWPIGGALVLIVGLFDMLDGAVARATGKATTFGAFLDSTLDRYSEAAIFLGLSVSAALASDITLVVLCYLASVGSLMVSYTRARAEGLGLRGDVGILQRPERVIVLGAGLIFGLLLPALVVLAVLTHLTTFQRVLFVHRQASTPQNSPDSGSDSAK